MLSSLPKTEVYLLFQQKKDHQAIVRIKDTGTGIDSELFPRLFSKFSSKSFSGTGLGLFIAKSIVEAHGGRIWVENNADGKGAMFSFALPLSSNTITKVIVYRGFYNVGGLA